MGKVGKMTIGLDASRATRGKKRGVEYYGEEIIKNLAKIDKKNRYILYSGKKPEGELKNLPKNFSWKIIPIPYLWTQFGLSLEMLKNPPDLLFIPSHTLPLIHPKKTVVTIHDLGVKYYPKTYSPFDQIYQNFCLSFSIRHASKIIVPSLQTKKDILKFFKVNPEKIFVIYHGFKEDLYKPWGIKSKEPYIFYLGVLEERKNISGLIKAFAILRKNPQIKHKLYLAGKRGFGYQNVQQTILRQSENVRRDIIELGYLSEERAAYYMKKADLFVFPSFFEGFGLPILEAMACQVPVACSEIPVLREIAKDSALFFDPKDPKEIAKVLEKIIKDEDLKKKLIKKGQENIKRFSWEKAAKETLKVFLE